MAMTETPDEVVFLIHLAAFFPMVLMAGWLLWRVPFIIELSSARRVGLTLLAAGAPPIMFVWYVVRERMEGHAPFTDRAYYRALRKTVVEKATKRERDLLQVCQLFSYTYLAIAVSMFVWLCVEILRL